MCACLFHRFHLVLLSKHFKRICLFFWEDIKTTKFEYMHTNCRNLRRMSRGSPSGLPPYFLSVLGFQCRWRACECVFVCVFVCVLHCVAVYGSVLQCALQRVLQCVLQCVVSIGVSVPLKGMGVCVCVLQCVLCSVCCSVGVFKWLCRLVYVNIRWLRLVGSMKI